MAYIGKQPIVGNFQVCDAISVVNGQAAYTMQVGSANVTPESANHMLVSLNGILQKPGSSFTISGATITFASNLATGDVIDFIILLGNVLDIGTPSDDTVGAAQIKNDLISGTTALATAPADTDEFLVSDAGTLKRIDYSLIKSANTPSFLIYKSASDGDQTLSSGSAVHIVMTGEKFDTDSACASSTFTVPSGQAGKYFFTVHATTASGNAANESAIFMIYKNGSAVSHKKNYFVNAGTHSFEHSLILDLSASDTIKFYIQDDTSCVLDSDDAATFTYMMGFKLA